MRGVVSGGVIMSEEKLDIITDDNSEELTEEQLIEIERQKEEALAEEAAKQRVKEITRQRNKLRKLFPDINFKKDTDTLLSNLIDEASFMFVTLKYLKEVINKKGVKENMLMVIINMDTKTLLKPKLIMQ